MSRFNRSIFMVVLFAAGCMPPPYNFTVNQLYVSGDFTGRNFGSSSICMGPVIGNHGVDSSGLLNSSNEYELISKAREDLHFVQTGEFESKYIKKTSSSLLNEFYKKLYNSEIMNLQTSEVFWKNVPGDYLMFFRLKKAVKLKTFTNTMRKDVELEAEIWDCSEMQVVWRALVKGSGVNDKLEDGKFVFDAVLQAYKTLPAAKPFYENHSW